MVLYLESYDFSSPILGRPLVVLCLSISRSEFSVTNYYNALLIELCGTVLLYSDVSKVG